MRIKLVQLNYRTRWNYAHLEKPDKVRENSLIYQEYNQVQRLLWQYHWHAERHGPHGLRIV